MTLDLVGRTGYKRDGGSTRLESVQQQFITAPHQACKQYENKHVITAIYEHGLCQLILPEVMSSLHTNTRITVSYIYIYTIYAAAIITLLLSESVFTVIQ